MRSSVPALDRIKPSNSFSSFFRNQFLSISVSQISRMLRARRAVGYSVNRKHCIGVARCMCLLNEAKSNVQHSGKNKNSQERGQMWFLSASELWNIALHLRQPDPNREQNTVHWASLAICQSRTAALSGRALAQAVRDAWLYIDGLCSSSKYAHTAIPVK